MNEMTPLQVAEVIQELHLHQVELQMQNEELTRARKEAEASHKQYQDLFDNAPVGYLTMRPDTSIIEANRAVGDLLGVGRSLLIGDKLVYSVDEQHRDRFYLHCKKVVANGEPDRCEVKLSPSEDHQKTVRLQSSLAVATHDQAPLIRTTVIDLTQQKETEAAVSTALKSWKATFDAAADPIVVLDSDYKIVRANRAATHFVGKSANEIKGQLCWKAFFQTEEPWPSPLRDSQNLTRRLTTEAYLPARGLWMFVSLDPIVDAAGKTRGSVYILRDITRQKKTEEHLTKLNEELERTLARLDRSYRELEEVSRVFAHDLKEPARTVAVLAEWLAGDYADAVDDHGKQKICLLTERSKQLGRRLDAMLKYTDTSAKPGSFRKIDLRVILQRVVKRLKPPRNVRILIPRKPPELTADPECLEFVFESLLSNAIQYNNKPRPLIKIKCADDGDFWQFSVNDNGIGIKKEYLEKLFKIFPRVESRETAGVGLAVARKLVEGCGGKIWLESEPGKGSTFFFTTPKQPKENK